MNEAETRAEHIDPALKAAGWGMAEGSRVRREYLIAPGRIEGAGKRGKPVIADYVLEYRNTKLAVIEAKAWDKDYAGKLALRFTYATTSLPKCRRSSTPRKATCSTCWCMWPTQPHR
jgi:type I restriction enzyme, R subunit